jgi:hypothetical protein
MKNYSTIEVLILEDGLHAKEVNRFGSEKPKKFIGESSPAQHGVRVRQWEDAESRLRIFDIDSVRGFLFVVEASGATPAITWVKPLEKHKAEILPSGKIKIL